MKVRLGVALFLVLAGCGSTRVVDRAADGTPILLCGAQPGAEQLASLARIHGVKTVVNLRGEKPGARWFREERDGVAAIGARWIHLPTNGGEPPEEELLDRFFAIVEDPDNWPVYVHCQSGMHRTGLLCAVYRIQYQGWSGADAVREMRSHGFRLSRTDRSAVEAWVKAYEPRPDHRLTER